MTGLLQLRDIRRALIRCPNWLGDTVMAIPTIRALRAALPEAELWCVGRWVPSILEAEPGIHRRLAYPRAWRPRFELARALGQVGLELAVLLPNSFESALHARLSRARWRVGYATDGRSWLLTHPVRSPVGVVHQVEAYLGLLARLGLAPVVVPPSLEVAPGRRAEARRLLTEIGVTPQDRAVGIQLGAAFGPSKLWPAEALAELATRLGQCGVPVVFLGTPSADPLLKSVAGRMSGPVRTLLGRDTPALLPALLAELSVMVTPDTGPAHVAAAVGVPVITLFGPTDPRLTAPRGERNAVLWPRPACAPCFEPRCPIDHRCMSAITVDAVLDAVRVQLAARAHGARVAAPG